MKSFTVLILLTIASFGALALHPHDVRFIAAFVFMLALCILWLGVYLLRHSSAWTGCFLILVGVLMWGVILLESIATAKGWRLKQPPPQAFASEPAF